MNTPQTNAMNSGANGLAPSMGEREGRGAVTGAMGKRLVRLSLGKGGSLVTGLLLAVGMMAATAYGEVRATGGHVLLYTENGINFVAHMFISNDTFIVTNPGAVEYLVVGGGGAGGRAYMDSSWGFSGGGGGAGGMLTGTASPDAGTYTMVVGAGGAATAGTGANGGNSYAFSNTAF